MQNDTESRPIFDLGLDIQFRETLDGEFSWRVDRVDLKGNRETVGYGWESTKPKALFAASRSVSRFLDRASKEQ